MNEAWLCFTLDGVPSSSRGYPLSHLLAVTIKSGKTADQTMDFYFTGEVIVVKGTGLRKLQEALFRGTHQPQGGIGAGWSVSSVSRRYYGS